MFMLTTPRLRPWLTTASRFSVAPPPCAFGAMSRSRSRFESSRSAGLVVFFVLTTPSLRPWLTTASRFSVAPPPCVFGALSCSIVDSNRHGRRDLSCFSCSRHRCFIGGTGSLALPGGFAAISVVPSTAYRERVDPRCGCSASARCGLLLWQSFFESSHSGRSRGSPGSPAGRSESL